MTQDDVIRTSPPICALDFGVPAEFAERAESYARWAVAQEREKRTGIQEFVTLPREVVEQALEALTCTGEHDDPGHRCTHCDDYVDRNGPTRAALRAALEQPQTDQPAMTPIAQRKLDSLLTEGYTISGYSIYHERKHQHGFVTGAGLVGWWKPDGVEYPQPRGEQEPFTVLVRKRSWPANQWEAAPRGFPDYWRSWADERVNVYTHPQPKRDPLTEKDIRKLLVSGDYLTIVGLIKFARAIEAAHNIK